MGAADQSATSGRQVAVRLRAAEPADCEAIHRWQTAEARKYFHAPQVPSAVEHRDWFRRRMSQDHPALWIIEIGPDAVGYVRLDLLQDSNDAAVSILVARPDQGRGVATAALKELRRLEPQRRIRAEIHPENLASRRAFEKAGYKPISAHVMISDPKIS